MVAKRPENSTGFKPRDHEESFLFYLFNDPEFVRRRDELSDTIKRHLGADALTVMLLLAPSNGLRTQLEERISNDPTSHISDILEDLINDIENLAKRFHVSIETVELGLRYTNHSAGAIFKSVPFARIEGDEIALRMNSKTRLEDIKAMFWYVSELQEQLPGYHPRNRDKERPDLIYAIYKQRLANKTFKEIYCMYENRKLSGYDGPATITGEESLATMYRRYKPNI